jgi:hypothetical protein
MPSARDTTVSRLNVLFAANVRNPYRQSCANCSSQVPQVAARSVAGLFAVQSLGFALFGFFVEMKLKFVAEILFVPPAVQQKSELLNK